mmetsp:Transcript_13082/g.30157  ORF Transcript_13082/g.30157 Transcript_13082/m.30157 type:complete len:301 (-) Transcript_13082:161-1063(-)
MEELNAKIRGREHQRQFIGRVASVRDPVAGAGHNRDQRVAQAEVKEEGLHFRLSGVDCSSEGRVLSYILHVQPVTVDLAVDNTLFEHHFVASQGARFVGQHKLDLTQIFGDARVASLDPRPRRLVPHRQVPLNKLCVEDLAQVQSHLDRDWNHRRVEQQEPQWNHNVLVPWQLLRELQVPHSCTVIVLPNRPDDSQHHHENELHSENANREAVDERVGLGELGARRPLVLAELGLVSSVHCHAEDPVDVAQVCGLQQKILHRERRQLAARDHGQVGVESVDFLIGRGTFHSTLEAPQIGR